MPHFTSHDGTSLFYRRWGEGRPVVFLHGWALNGDVWQTHLLELSEQGCSAIAFDRRGHGRSEDPGGNYSLDSLADDLAALLGALDLTNVTLVGHSMGSAEIVRYITRHGAERVERIVMAAAAMPYLLRTDDNPDGPNDPAVLKDWRRIWRTNFLDWVAAAVPASYGPDAPPGRVQWVVQQMTGCTPQAAIATNIASAETDLRGELPNVQVPCLLIHGDEDQSCPLDLTGRKVAALLPNATLKVYPGARHAVIGSHAGQMCADILDFMGGPK